MPRVALTEAARRIAAALGVEVGEIYGAKDQSA